MGRFYILCLAVNGLLAVTLGAFGAHELKNWLTPELLETYHTAVQYQMFHSVALLAVAWLAQSDKGGAALRWSGGLFIAGLLLFCGSLYLLALSGQHWLGAITPVGGVALLAAWALLAKAAWEKSVI
ncbi:MAG: DUF423 domain-containing protein [Gammaproteobacteria bacterium]